MQSSFRDSHSTTPASTPAPLPAAEIESLLRAAQQRQIAADNHGSIEELGPGDVQHFRGLSDSPSNISLDPVNHIGTSTDIDQSLQKTERRLAEAILETSVNQRQDFNAMNSREPQPPRASEKGRLTFDDLGAVDLDISIELGRTEILIEEILKLREGSVVALDRTAGDPVDIVANGRLVARGELLVIDGKFGVRLSEVL